MPLNRRLNFIWMEYPFNQSVSVSIRFTHESCSPPSIHKSIPSSRCDGWSNVTFEYDKNDGRFPYNKLFTGLRWVLSFKLLGTLGMRAHFLNPHLADEQPLIVFVCAPYYDRKALTLPLRIRTIHQTYLQIHTLVQFEQTLTPSFPPYFWKREFLSILSLVLTVVELCRKNQNHTYNKDKKHILSATRRNVQTNSINYCSTIYKHQSENWSFAFVLFSFSFISISFFVWRQKG